MSAGGPQDRIAYRPEIDGLRAIAVLAVILFHTGIPAFGGGYLGVDLFFAISGYLITGILAGELAEGRFSIWRFYERRIRRIIPALMLVMLLCIPFALWLMIPDDLENFGQSLVGTTFFANNILLLLTTGYFGLEVQFKPLMHTWSLGIEEQYYLVVPLLMWGMWRLGKARGLLIGIAGVTALSFAACLYLQRSNPNADFYLIITRGWELGLGGLVALIEPQVRARVDKRAGLALVVAGMALAAYPFLAFTRNPTPGLLTATHVLGICLILLFGSARDPLGRVLSTRPFVAIGLISYSAYLFHQPVFAFVRIASLDPPPQWLTLALIAPILLLAWLSWRFVEQPCRDRTRVPTKKLLIGSGAAALVTLAAGLTFHLTSGFYSRWPELAGSDNGGRFANIAYNMAPESYLKVQLPETSDKVRVLVIGNSFARDFVNMTIESGRATNHIIALIEFANCGLPPFILAQARRADYIVIASRYDVGNVKCVRRRVERLQNETSARIIVIGRKSFGYNNNAVMRLPIEQRINWRVLPSPEAAAANAMAKALLPADVYVDTNAMLGDAQGRVRVFTPEGKFISQDREHLTRPGAIYVGGILFRHPALAAMLAGKPEPR